MYVHELFFFFNDTATTEIYTLSLHDALPIYRSGEEQRQRLDRTRQGRRLEPVAEGFDHPPAPPRLAQGGDLLPGADRKSTRLNSSHANISYAVFCLKKKIYTQRAHVLRPITL